MTFSVRSQNSLMRMYLSEICNRAGTQIQYTETLIAVMSSAT